MANRNIPSMFLKTALQNGVGRYVCQLQRLTFKFCKEQAGSRGMRDFLENKLIGFTEHNPGVAVYVQAKRHRAPKLVAEYLDGNVHTIHTANYSKEEIEQWLDWLRTRSGVPIARIRKYQHTHNPSIQGTWSPNTNKDSAINLATFPDAKLSAAHKFKPSATEILLEASRALSEKSCS